MIITGFHSIEEKIRAAGAGSAKGAGQNNLKLYYSKAGPRVKKILAAAEAGGIKSAQVPDAKLDELVSSLDEALRDHRGIVMEIADGSGKSKAAGANLVDFDAWLKTGGREGARGSEVGTGGARQRTIVVMLDRVTDPHNVGAIIRSCDQFGAALVVLPEHKAASDIAGNEIIGRASAGASAWVPVAVVNNLARAAEKLKDAGFWLYGADAGGRSCREIEFPEKTVLVMGSEGTGIADLLEKQCDEIVSIPTCGKIDSLNVSVAAGVLLYEVSTRQI
jgi:23S rRNA (guanosine2251-2'-O)-methyltransferase